jgi:hypothetical protein
MEARRGGRSVLSQTEANGKPARLFTKSVESISVNPEIKWVWHTLGDSDIAELETGSRKPLLERMKIFKIICR